MDKLDFKVPKEYYYKEMKQFTDEILKAVGESSIQQKYREYMSKYRYINEKILEEASMFYILDGEEEIEDIFRNNYIKDVAGINSRDFLRVSEKFVFPIFTPNKVIAGWCAYDYESYYKYSLYLSKFMEKKNLFFNTQNIDKCYRESVCLLVEGIFDSLRLNEIGFKNNLSLMGKTINEFQRDVLNRFDLIIAIPDNDEAGNRAFNQWRKLIKTKLALVNLRKEKFNKRVMKGDKFEYEECTIKDVDDYLRHENSDNKKIFIELYNRILKESKNPFFKQKVYTI